jgi:hypothetical protein
MPATYEPIATVTANGSSNPITFTSIPATYTDLRFVISCRANQGTGGGGYSNFTYRYNSDSSSIYSFVEVVGDGASATSYSATANTYNIVGSGYSIIGKSDSPLNLVTVDVFNYAGSNHKTSLAASSSDRNGSGTVVRNVNLWRNTAAITSVSFDVDAFGGVSGRAFASGSTFTLYGIKNA